MKIYNQKYRESPDLKMIEQIEHEAKQDKIFQVFYEHKRIPNDIIFMYQ